MKRKIVLSIALVLAPVSAAVGLIQAQGFNHTIHIAGESTLGTAFTYQGRLTDAAGNPIDGSCDFRFRLYDDATVGSQIGSEMLAAGVAVGHGYFTAQLDFGLNAFDGGDRWLEIDVRCPAGNGSYTTLAPRQKLTASPYALFAAQSPWPGLTGVPAGFADGVDDDTTYSAGTGLTLSSTQFSADTTYLQRRISSACSTGYALREIAEDGSVTCEPVAGGAGDITGVSAGEGLLGGGESGAITLTVAFSGTGVLDSAARSDHDHDDRYFTESELSSDGGGGQVHWNNLTSVPAGFTDGVDNDTTYTAGDGLTLTGTQFSADDALTRDSEVPGLVAATGYITQTLADELYSPSSHLHAGEDITSGTVADARIDSALARDSEIMPTVLANDGTGSSLDADRLDGLHSTAFATSIHTHPGSDITSAVSTATLALFANQSPWSGLTGVPAGFADGTDNDTTYTNGFGLNLSSTQFSVNTSTVQTRVSGTCAVGSTIRAINADGTVVCQADGPLSRSAMPADSSRATLIGSGTVVSYTSATIGTDGLPLISFYDATNGDLRVAHCEDAACASVTVSTLDSAGDVGQYSSVIIGPDGLGLISYYDVTNADLKVARCANVTCTSAASSNVVDGAAVNIGQWSSITIGADGLALISYYDVTNTSLKVAHCNNASCASAATATLDTGGVGQYTSITIVAGRGLISYYKTGGGLKTAYCANTACSTATVSAPDGGASGLDTSITVGRDGLGLISYYVAGGDLKVAHCSNAACSAVIKTTLDNTGNVGQYTSITVDSTGLGLISYYDVTSQDLKVARCVDISCTGASVSTLDSTGNVGLFTSITIGADGLGLISYVDATNGTLKVNRCSNDQCVPYFRRR